MVGHSLLDISSQELVFVKKQSNLLIRHFVEQIALGPSFFKKEQITLFALFAKSKR